MLIMSKKTTFVVCETWKYCVHVLLYILFLLFPFIITLSAVTTCSAYTIFDVRLLL